MQEFIMRFYLLLGKSRLWKKYDFIVSEGLYMMIGEGFYFFIQVFTMS